MVVTPCDREVRMKRGWRMSNVNENKREEKQEGGA